jgi:hypothetical protein
MLALVLGLRGLTIQFDKKSFGSFLGLMLLLPMQLASGIEKTKLEQLITNSFVKHARL